MKPPPTAVSTPMSTAMPAGKPISRVLAAPPTMNTPRPTASDHKNRREGGSHQRPRKKKAAPVAAATPRYTGALTQNTGS
ncbi:MAG: hypothetical protein K9L18_12325 [Desulfarculaceae bacterium]|nr:hypothetical protein [Desulfarculaceae bacterium]